MFAATRHIHTSPATFVKGSVVFDGSGDYLSVGDSISNRFGTGNFTVEAWVRPASVTTRMPVFSTYTSGNGLWVEVASTRIDVGNGDAYLSQTEASFATGTWYHIAVTRSSGTLKVFKNGSEIASYANSTNFQGATTSRIGVHPSLEASSLCFNGNISNLRILTGSAQYTSNFTVPTSRLTAVTNTSLLTCQNPTTITDASTNAFTITAYGNAAASSLSPF
jgi:hypothetical protein